MSESRNYSVASAVTTAVRNDAGRVSPARVLAKVAVLLLVLLQSLQHLSRNYFETLTSLYLQAFLFVFGLGDEDHL